MVVTMSIAAVIKGELQVLWLGFYYLPTVWSVGFFMVFILWQRRRNNPLFISLQRSSVIEYTAYGATMLMTTALVFMFPLRTYAVVFLIALCSLLPVIPDRRSYDRFVKPLLFLATSGAAIGALQWHEHHAAWAATPAWSVPPLMVAIIFGGAGLVFLISSYIASESDKSEAALQVAHAESEKLLLNILPLQVSEELKATGRTTPREYASTTVLFTDFVGFTRIAENLSAVELVSELDKCFSYFDSVAEKYGLEKLKTIGDAYMAAGGIPTENHTHPIDCALAALEIQSFMNQMKEIKEQRGLPYWELRLGMHTGPLVAGVVGEKKFAYDVWGDTVNTASRMESSGEPGAINISQEMHERIRFLFECEYRGKVYAKNKGEIEMYFLRGLKPKYSVSGLGRVPNGDFKDIYARVKNGAKLVAKA